MTLTENGEKWACPTLELFLLGYARATEASYFRTSYFEGFSDSIFSFTAFERAAHVQIEAPDREELAAVINVFESELTNIGSADNSPAGIEYAGIAGVTAECKDAVMRLLQYGDHVTHARILSCSGTHAFLLTVNVGDRIAIKSGFGSGYAGEGPHGLSFVLELLEETGAVVSECEVREDLIRRLDDSALTQRDIEAIDTAQSVWPGKRYEYAFVEDIERRYRGELWRDFPLALPWAIIDPRIIDLATKFREHPNDSLRTGYARLEDIVRGRIGSGEHGIALFSVAFLREPPKLLWEGVSPAEQKGRGNLFIGAYMAHRNPRAHRELGDDANSKYTEFLLLNHLYLIEKTAVVAENA